MSAKQEIEAFFAEFTDAWDKYDVDRIAGAYAEDSHLISPSGSDHRSRSSTAELMRGMAPAFAGSTHRFHDLELRHIQDNLEFFDITHTAKFASGKVHRTSGIHGCCANV
jgi:uncharacterized protein (TIGR02246 family)